MTDTTKLTMADAKRRNKAAGYHFFDKGTNECFNAGYESGLLAGDYFIDSTRMPRYYDWRTGEVLTYPLHYHVRYFDRETGRVETVSYGHDSREDAMDALKAARKAGITHD